MGGTHQALDVEVHHPVWTGNRRTFIGFIAQISGSMEFLPREPFSFHLRMWADPA